MTTTAAIEVVWHLHRAEATETTMTTAMITLEDVLESGAVAIVRALPEIGT